MVGIELWGLWRGVLALVHRALAPPGELLGHPTALLYASLTLSLAFTIVQYFSLVAIQVSF